MTDDEREKVEAMRVTRFAEALHELCIEHGVYLCAGYAGETDIYFVPADREPVAPRMGFMREGEASAWMLKPRPPEPPADARHFARYLGFKP